MRWLRQRRARPPVDLTGFVRLWTPSRWSSWPAIRMRRRLMQTTVVLLLVLAVLALVAVAVHVVGDRLRERAVAEQLRGVRIVTAVADVPGYDRDCGRGQGCVFGPAWSDDVDVPGGHDGCDTRNDVLARDLTDVVTRPGTDDCVVTSGVLIDPYTGLRVDFVRGQNPQPVQIDHVVPLAAAWDRGAAAWTPQRRRDFANDPIELLATTASVNAAKRDHTPESWQPEPPGRCRYAQTFIRVVVAYQLTVTRADVAALSDQLRTCSG